MTIAPKPITGDCVEHGIEAAQVTLLTVTYGRRQDYVAELLRTAFAEGIGSAILVANGPNPALAGIVAGYGGRVTLVELPANAGSAVGYTQAITAAYDTPGAYFWFMDDDNAPGAGALGRLLSVLADAIATHGKDNSAVLGYRADHSADIGAGVPLNVAFAPRGSFLGFDFRIAFYKLRRRLFGVRAQVLDPEGVVQIPYASYGGLVVHRDCLTAIGWPREDFVLYGDDTEYTFRITERGGAIFLVKGAEIVDQEGSWNFQEDPAVAPLRNRTSFDRYLEDGADFRIFYTIRNRVWCDRFRYRGPALIFQVNKWLFMTIMRIKVWKGSSGARLTLIERAVRDGESGRLGLDAHVRLP